MGVKKSNPQITNVTSVIPVTEDPKVITICLFCFGIYDTIIHRIRHKIKTKPIHSLAEKGRKSFDKTDFKVSITSLQMNSSPALMFVVKLLNESWVSNVIKLQKLEYKVF